MIRLEKERELMMESETVNRMNEDVLIEILVKLPPESIFRFKSVSRRWRDLLSSPSFVQRHAAAHHHRPGSLIALFQEAAVHETSETKTAKHCNTLPLLPICKGNALIGVIPKHVGHFINSSNGLILFSRTHGSVITYHVANPLTGKFVELPPPPHGKRCLVVDEYEDKYRRSYWQSSRRRPPLLSAGLICNQENKNYSVVRAGMHFLGIQSRIYIDSYSSKTGKWSAMRKVTATGIFNLCEKPMTPVVANGVIHWYTTKGNIAVYDPNDEHMHVQLIGMPFAGKKNDSYAVTRSAADDDDMLWLGLVRRHNLLFYKLPKSNGGSYKRPLNVDAKEWELVHQVSTHALSQKSSTNNNKLNLKKRRPTTTTGFVACKKTVLECLMSVSEVVALLRQDDKVFLYNVHKSSIEKVDYSGRYNQNHALSPYFKSSSLRSYCL